MAAFCSSPLVLIADWTDLPTRTAYVPLIHGLVGYAAHLSAASQRPRGYHARATRLLGREEDDGTTVTIHTPDGQERLGRYYARWRCDGSAIYILHSPWYLSSDDAGKRRFSGGQWHACRVEF